MSKRYIFFIGTLCGGGAERVVATLSSCMAEQGMAVEILTYYDKPITYEVNSKVKISVVEKLTGKTSKVQNLFEVRKYFKQNAKVVISFLAPFNMMAIVSKLGTGIPIVVADRNDPTKVPFNKYIRKLRDFLYMFAEGIVLQTEKNREYFSNVVKRKSTVIYNPVDMKVYAGVSLKTEKEKKIVSAGRLMRQKNHKMMIDAFAEVIKDYPEYQLIIYGEGPYREELERYIQELKISEKVFLPGNTTELHEQIKNAEIFVLSSDYEGMPNALIEAMCMGIPVISTKVSGATDLIYHGENGILVDVNDSFSLKKAMMELIENKEKANVIAKRATELNAQLEVKKIMDQWISFIQEIC